MRRADCATDTVATSATGLPHAASMTPNPGKARWALRKAAEARAALDALPVGGTWQERARRAQAVTRLLAEESRYRAMASRWAPDVAA